MELLVCARQLLMEWNVKSKTDTGSHANHCSEECDLYVLIKKLFAADAEEVQY
jgi:hypothetical protein